MLAEVAEVADVEAEEEPAYDLARAVADYLRTRRVAPCTLAEDAVLVDIHAPLTLAALDEDLNVEPLLELEPGRSILGNPGSASRPHLDQAAVLLASEFGRDLTQHCSLAIWDVHPPYAGIAYRSRHDLNEWCWAVYDRNQVDFAEAVPLVPEDPYHSAAVRAAADLWGLPLNRWTT